MSNQAEKQEKPAEETAVVERSVEYVPLGATDKLKLTARMVHNFVAVPTKSGKLPTERDCIRFIMLCMGKKANPFEGDCYLIGYDNREGPPTFSLVCGVDLFLKRAEHSGNYNGRESGVIIQKGDTLVERHGSLVLDGEKLIGGWAKIFRKDRSFPEYKTVKLSTYDTGRSRWAKDPGGMIEKVALSQALRTAYPTALGGLYTQEEMDKITETGQGLIEAPIEMTKAVAPSQANGGDDDDSDAGTTIVTPEGLEFLIVEAGKKTTLDEIEEHWRANPAYQVEQDFIDVCNEIRANIQTELKKGGAK